MQVNQLLTLIEDFPGISILTTNLKQGLDAAFSRRIAYKIQFELPERDERAALWRMYLPPNQLSRNEIARLTEKFDRVSGAEIRNGVLRAASAPASIAAGRLTCAQVERSLVAELQSAGSVVSSL
jgi:AAA+ superfamily predicted ATPase